MQVCACREVHTLKRIVLTGGPGAGKTAVLELCRQYLCVHAKLLPESASLLFSGGFPRTGLTAQRAATQRAIYHVQRELERIGELDQPAILLCDRGTVDGAAYWPGPGSLFEAVGTTRELEVQRYDVVVHLRTPPAPEYNHDNPWRYETALEAAVIDARIAEAWQGHPRCLVVDNHVDFLVKAQRALALLRAELPECCRARLPAFGEP